MRCQVRFMATRYKQEGVDTPMRFIFLATPYAREPRMPAA